MDISIASEAQNMLPSPNDVQLLGEKYFTTIYHRLPILSRKRFMKNVPTVYSKPRADFLALCMSIYLALQYPEKGLGMQTESYVRVKSMICLLEATGVLSMEVLQTRL